MSRIQRKFVFHAAVNATTAPIASRIGAETAQITAPIAVTAVVIAGIANPIQINHAVSHKTAVVHRTIHLINSGFAFAKSVNHVING